MKIESIMRSVRSQLGFRHLHGLLTAALVYHAAISSTQNVLSLQNAPEKGDRVAHAQSIACVFDDIVYQLDWEQKNQLRQQLAKHSLDKHLDKMHSPTWLHCAFEGEICECSTQIRFGHPGIERRFYSAPRSCNKMDNCHVKCDKAGFKDMPLGVSHEAHCECLVPFKLTMKANSKTYLEEALFFLLRLTAHARLIPATGDRIKSGSRLWLQREPKKNTELYGAGWLDRDWNHMFWRDSAEMLREVRGKCLEWGLRRTPRLPQCTSLYEFQLSRNREEFGIRKSKENTGNRTIHTVVSDIFALSSTIQKYGILLDLIFAEQVFEHVENPFEAAKSCFESLHPGGALIVTVPHATQLHVGPKFLDYFRFSKHALKLILESAGFCVPNKGFAGGGDYIFEMARNLGLGRDDFSQEEIQGAYQRGFENLSEGATNIMAVAFRSPTRHCTVQNTQLPQNVPTFEPPVNE